ncbi:DUF4349 domain-containing protein [Aquihabitans sp. G128]|uniref:DUF4349 domain-containing protein n=1 Tax=Aquihabitans sp. G128 TaxID=2849779 RepID=UPI001C23238A|nr:DUF4349 domain-containing protein [Aquihabitans sp. G128]QXC63215.1 DUF4349 domain-containing protein [Aquihabitans sp. G128]
MSVSRLRRSAPPRSSAARPAGRSRALTILGAVVALVAVAAVIGSHADDGTDHSKAAAQRTTAGSRAGADSAVSDQLADAPEASTTVAAPSTGDADRAVDEGAASSGGTAAADQVQPVGAPADAKIIRTGSLQVRVQAGSFADGTAGLTRIATGLGGFVSASEISSFEDDPSGTLTLRIPADQFDKAVAEIGKLGTVQALTTGSQDVTGEYTDVASRLKALQAEREQINLVLSRAQSIPDILSVRDRLAAVQGEIEQAQGRQKVLDDQTSLSTLTVQLSEKGSATSVTKPAPERTGLAKLWHDGVDRFTDGGRSIALGLATLAPWLLLALVLWLPARLLWRRLAPVAPAAPATPATAAD